MIPTLVPTPQGRVRGEEASASRVPSPLLVARAQLGDLRALDAVLAAMQGPLHRHIAQIVGDGDAADDVLQETLLAVARHLGALRDPCWFRAWAYRTATRLAVRHARRERGRVAVLEPLEGLAAPEAEPPALDPEAVAEAAAALERVPPAARLVLRLHYLEGLALAEVAEALELPVGTVKSRLAYGLTRLRELVGETRSAMR